MTKKTFMQGAVILGAAGVFIKILGAVFRIPLANMIGPLGMSYFQSAYPVYVFFLTLATAGIPLAISKMVSERVAIENFYEAHRVFKISFILLFLIGITSSSICFFGAETIMTWTGVPEARHSMMSIAPALLIVPMMAAYRGYFQGMHNMKLTAISQSVEQFFRVATGLTLAYYLLRFGLEFSAAGAAFGATAGALAGLICVLIIYAMHRSTLKAKIEKSKGDKLDKMGAILTRIMIIAVPITIGAAIMPIMNTIDVGMVVRVLVSIGYYPEEAQSMYGQLAGMVGPIINFPQVLTQAIAMSLVPAVSIAHKQQDIPFMHQNIKMGLRSAIIVGLPCAFGFMVLSRQIMLLLYPLQREGAINAADLLFIMGIGVVFLATVQTLTGVLQGIGKQLIPVRNLAIGAVAKLIISYTLIVTPGVGVRGAAIGTVTAFVIASILNLIAVRKYTGVKIDIKLTFLKPALAGLAMAFCVWATYTVISLVIADALSTLISIVIGAMVYFFMILKIKVVTMDELAKMPKGAKLVKIAHKFKLN